MAPIALAHLEATSQEALNYHLKRQVFLREDYFEEELSLEFKVALATEVLRTHVEDEGLRDYTITIDGGTGSVVIERDVPLSL